MFILGKGLVVWNAIPFVKPWLKGNRKLAINTRVWQNSMKTFQLTHWLHGIYNIQKLYLYYYL